jgi:hypothetical protein
MNRSESLCENCTQMREVVTPRGSRFLLCTLAQVDRRFARYPPQPVLQCLGYRPAPAGGPVDEAAGQEQPG